MVVLQINAVYKSGSTGIIVSELVEQIKDIGGTALVATPTKHCGEDVTIGNSIDHLLHAAYTRMSGKQGLASTIETHKFLKKLDVIQPDIIHLHNIHSNYLNYKIFFTYTSSHNIPVVITLHDCWTFTGKCNHFIDVDCKKWLTECKSCPKMKKEIVSMFFDSSTKVFNLKKQLYKRNRLYIVGCSKWIESCARSSPLFENKYVTQFYNGIDVDVFSPAGDCFKEKLNIKKEFVILTMANKWYEQKNSDARNAVLDLMQEEDRVLVIGCSKEQLNLNEDRRLIKIGFVQSPEDMARIYRTSHVFLNLTLADTLPTVNMEAASCGVPVITYSSGGSGELVIDSETGFVIEPHNITALKQAILSVKNGKIATESCRIWAVNSFDKKKNYQKYIKLYQDIYEYII